MHAKAVFSIVVLAAFCLPALSETPQNICAKAALSSASTDQRAICTATRRWITAFKTGDLEQFMSLYTSNPQVALHGQPKLTGIDAVRAYFAPALAAKREVAFLLHVEDIQVNGDIAYLISRYWYTSVAKDEATYQDAGRSLLIYQRDRRHDEWKIHVDIDQATPDVTFPAPPSAE